MAIDLSDYNTVPERILEAKLSYPDGRFQSRIVDLPTPFADKFIAVEAMFYRTADDPRPAVGLAWEAVPGKTPYTRDSELMNAETSAWGRALIAAFAADAKKGVASREEVQSRTAVEPRPRSGMKRTPKVTEGQESHENGSTERLTSEQALQIQTMKKALLGRLEGDRQEARRLWEGTLEMFSLAPGDPIPADMISPLEHAIKALAIKGEE